MPTSNSRTRTRRQAEPKAQPRTNRDDGAKAKAKKSDYEETANWASAFERPDNEAPQPGFTGTGVLDLDTLRAIAQADGDFQIAVWLRRSKSGKRYLRFHIEPPYEGSEPEDADDFFGDDDAPEVEAEADDDMPF